MSEWQPIETAPRKQTIIVSDGDDFFAVGYLAKVRWYLGDYPNRWRTGLGFKPIWWMHKDVRCNPMRVPFPQPPAIVGEQENDDV